MEIDIGNVKQGTVPSENFPAAANEDERDSHQLQHNRDPIPDAGLLACHGQN